MDTEFKNAVLGTLAYFDLFEYPLSSRELYENLWGLERRIGFFDYLIELNELCELGLIEHKEGYYFFPGKNFIEKRDTKIKWLEQKMLIAKRGAKLLRFIPFVEAVFVCNTVASGFLKEDSDIDLFIVIKNGRIWLSRFLVTFVLSLFRLRRNKKKIKNRLCLSFYITDKNLNLKKIAIDDDIYLAYWINNLIPIYDPNGYLNEIVKQNDWVCNFFRHFGSQYKVSRYWMVKKDVLGISIRKFLENFWNGTYGDILEKYAKTIQLSKMNSNLYSLQNKNDTRVIINDEMLKFHENDRREKYRNEWIVNKQKYDVLG